MKQDRGIRDGRHEQDPRQSKPGHRLPGLERKPPQDERRPAAKAPRTP
jgi:hypothetical protein